MTRYGRKAEREGRVAKIAISKKQLGVFTWLAFCPQGLELGTSCELFRFSFRQRTKAGNRNDGISQHEFR